MHDDQKFFSPPPQLFQFSRVDCEISSRIYRANSEMCRPSAENDFGSLQLIFAIVLMLSTGSPVQKSCRGNVPNLIPVKFSEKPFYGGRGRGTGF